MTLDENSGKARAIQSRALVLANRPIAKDTFQLRIEQPEIARRIAPGQFVMMRMPDRTDPLLARPYALYDTFDDDRGNAAGLEIVYLVVGNGTRSLSTAVPGSQVELWGPLGNSFPSRLSKNEGSRLLIVAGGIGQTPFLAVIKELLGARRYGSGRQIERPRHITLTYGARSAEYLAGVDDFRATGVEVQIATNDGSAGYRGYVTDLAERAFASSNPPTDVFGCGPEPMLRILADIADRFRATCWVSLENKMACGYGVCFSCVCPIKEADSWDYARVCLEGPVFSADQVAWDHL